jgi:hypothetical protein
VSTAATDLRTRLIISQRWYCGHRRPSEPVCSGRHVRVPGGFHHHDVARLNYVPDLDHYVRGTRDIDFTDCVVLFVVLGINRIIGFIVLVDCIAAFTNGIFNLVNFFVVHIESIVNIIGWIIN